MGTKNLSNLLAFPGKKYENYQWLIAALDEQADDELSAYLNWFVAECLHHFGSEQTVDFLHRHASRRVQRNTILSEFDTNTKFERIIDRHFSVQCTLELQSAAGLFDSLLRFQTISLLKTGMGTEECVQLTGSSRRSVQRIRRQHSV